jgi:hypothetical protein
MGFLQVVIIGMDHRFNTNGGPNEKAHMSPDTNHFSTLTITPKTERTHPTQASKSSYQVPAATPMRPKVFDHAIADGVLYRFGFDY